MRVAIHRTHANCWMPVRRKSAKKLGEEAIETIIAALGKDQKAVMRESADLVYHLLVLLNSWGVPLSDVVAELGRRTGKSGLAEKAERSAS